jgi:uncharacterized protein YnzC (UPF0291/DUF896 family)
VPKRFTNEELAILKICERNGWTYKQWYALDEDEQVDRLALEHRRVEYLDTMLNSFRERIDDEKIIDQSAYIMALIERYT